MPAAAPVPRSDHGASTMADYRTNNGAGAGSADNSSYLSPLVDDPAETVSDFLSDACISGTMDPPECSDKLTFYSVWKKNVVEADCHAPFPFNLAGLDQLRDCPPDRGTLGYDQPLLNPDRVSRIRIERIAYLAAASVQVSRQNDGDNSPLGDDHFKFLRALRRRVLREQLPSRLRRQSSAPENGRRAVLFFIGFPLRIPGTSKGPP